RDPRPGSEHAIGEEADLTDVRSVEFAGSKACPIPARRPTTRGQQMAAAFRGAIMPNSTRGKGARRGKWSTTSRGQARATCSFNRATGDSSCVAREAGNTFLNQTGEHVTSIRRPDSAHQARLRDGRIRPATDGELGKLKRLL